MLKDIKTIINRPQNTLIQDAIGAVALLVILMGGLSLPSFF